MSSFWRSLKGRKNLGTLMLGVWLIVMGLVQLIDLHFLGMHVITGALAITAGVLIVLGR